MNKHIIIVIMFALSLTFVQAQSKFVKKAETDSPQLLQEGTTKAWCPICGMNLKMFYKTSHALELEDGSFHQYCSIRCLAMDLHDYPGQIDHVQVIDFRSERFIPVRDAYYVVGSKVPGTMTKVSKLAFTSKQEAEKFSKKMKGKEILRFEEVLALSRKQMQADNAMLMKKKKSIVFPKGEKLYLKLCEGLGTLPTFESMVVMKAYLKAQSNCKTLDEKQLQMLALYIWTFKQNQPTGDNSKTLAIPVPKGEKCPVCGMFVYKYPRWVAVLDVTVNDQHKKLYFDGVKDLVKFYHDPQKWENFEKITIQDIMVTDYYRQTALDGKNALYVIGSDILGPMGHELIPFDSKAQANVFLNDHSGTQIVKFDEITRQMIIKLDN